MQRTHREIADQHKLAAKSHLNAAGEHEKGDNPNGSEHAQQALHHADRAHELALEAHNKSGRIESL